MHDYRPYATARDSSAGDCVDRCKAPTPRADGATARRRRASHLIPRGLHSRREPTRPCSPSFQPAPKVHALPAGAIAPAGLPAAGGGRWPPCARGHGSRLRRCGPQREPRAGVNWWARPCACAAFPPLLAISRCLPVSIEAKPRLLFARSELLCVVIVALVSLIHRGVMATGLLGADDRRQRDRERSRRRFVSRTDLRANRYARRLSLEVENELREFRHTPTRQDGTGIRLLFVSTTDAVSHIAALCAPGAKSSARPRNDGMNNGPALICATWRIATSRRFRPAR